MKPPPLDEEEWDSIMKHGDGCSDNKEEKEEFVPMTSEEIHNEVNKMIKELK